MNSDVQLIFDEMIDDLETSGALVGLLNFEAVKAKATQCNLTLDDDQLREALQAKVKQGRLTVVEIDGAPHWGPPPPNPPIVGDAEADDDDLEFGEEKRPADGSPAGASGASEQSPQVNPELKDLRLLASIVHQQLDLGDVAVSALPGILNAALEKLHALEGLEEECHVGLAPARNLAEVTERVKASRAKAGRYDECNSYWQSIGPSQPDLTADSWKEADKRTAQTAAEAVEARDKEIAGLKVQLAAQTKSVSRWWMWGSIAAIALLLILLIDDFNLLRELNQARWALEESTTQQVER